MPTPIGEIGSYLVGLPRRAISVGMELALEVEGIWQ
jgi:hypothetical protein